MFLFLDFVLNIHYQLFLTCCVFFVLCCKFKEIIQSWANTLSLSLKNNQPSSHRPSIDNLWNLLFNFWYLNLIRLLSHHFLTTLLIIIIVVISVLIVTIYDWFSFYLLFNLFIIVLLDLFIGHNLLFALFRIGCNYG